ncbi:MAG: PDZ domain-containing protein [Deltaproteobacteria bacterium]|nr:PDZ domain-containing protein [Deltaproteobacteria bacterium]
MSGRQWWVAAVLLGTLEARAQTPSTAPGTLHRATVTVLGRATTRTRGVILSGDGRVLTTMAAVEGAPEVRVRYPDGRTDRARVVATDPAWGVCLLECSAVRWPEGVSLAERDVRVGTEVLWPGALGTAASAVRGVARRRRSLPTATGLLREAWELTPSPAGAVFGAPVMHARDGTVVSLLVPAPSAVLAGSAPPGVGVPLAVLRALRERAGQSGLPWLGVVARELVAGQESVVSASSGLRVLEVQPGSPAQRVGLRGGEHADVILQVEGREVNTLTDLGAVLEGRRPGERVLLRILRAGAVHDVPVALEAVPSRP